MGHGQGTRYSACTAKRSGTPPAPATTRGVLVAGTALAWAALVWWAWRQFDRVEVFGLSMAPTLEPGDHLLVHRTTSLCAGDIVAATDPREPGRTVLKRVAEVGDTSLVLLGDNPAHSTDSRLWGRVPIASVQGRAIYRYSPPQRAGRLANDRRRSS